MMLKKLNTLISMIKTFKNWYQIILAKYNLFGKGLLICKVRNNLSFIIRKGTTDHSIISDIIRRRIYDKFYPIKKGFIVIDIGAHIGIFSIYAASRGAIVYGYEPEKDNFKIFVKNIYLNSLQDKIHPFRLAVDGTQGFTFLSIAENNLCHSIINFQSKRKQKIKKVTLKSIFKTNKIKYCDFLKMDCEGSEYNIICKTPKDIFKKIGFIVIAYHKIKEHAYKEIVEILKKNKFEVRIFSHNIKYNLRYNPSQHGHLEKGYIYATALHKLR